MNVKPCSKCVELNLIHGLLSLLFNLLKFFLSPFHFLCQFVQLFFLWIASFHILNCSGQSWKHVRWFLTLQTMGQIGTCWRRLFAIHKAADFVENAASLFFSMWLVLNDIAIDHWRWSKIVLASSLIQAKFILIVPLAICVCDVFFLSQLFVHVLQFLI